MGRLTGLLSGVLFTSSVAYYTKREIDGNLLVISSCLRRSDEIINNSISPVKHELVPINNKINTNTVSISSTLTDIWNREIISFVNFIYSINWYQLGLEVDKKVVQLVDIVGK